MRAMAGGRLVSGCRDIRRERPVAAAHHCLVTTLKVAGKAVMRTPAVSSEPLAKICVESAVRAIFDIDRLQNAPEHKLSACAGRCCQSRIWNNTIKLKEWCLTGHSGLDTGPSPTRLKRATGGAESRLQPAISFVGMFVWNRWLRGKGFEPSTSG